MESDSLTVVEQACDLFFPDAFTPNGDGLNDVLFARLNMDIMSLKEFSVFNRWGERVFYTTNQSSGWDGTDKSTPSEQGVYVYLIRYAQSGVDKILKGNVTLIR
jgi:gliding motility-associated-like protein